MNIRSLDKMESIVAGNKNLHWDGWSVVSMRYSPTAWSKPDGIFYKGKWYTQRTYPLTETGWDIPAKIAE